MSEKARIKKRSDREIVQDSDAIDLVVDLDRADTTLSTERRSGLSLARVCIIHGGKKIYAWLHVACVGFDMDDKRGFDFHLAVVKTGGESDRKINVKMKRDGFDMGE